MGDWTKSSDSTSEHGIAEGVLGRCPIQFDKRLKLLLLVFFREFVELFFPRFAAVIDWSVPVEFLDKELHSILPKTRGRTVDVLVKVRTRRPPESRRHEQLALLHVELEAGRSRRRFAKRMHRYFHRALDWFELPVIPMALYLRVAAEGLGWEVYELVYWDQRFVEFTFPYAALPGLDGVKYIESSNPLAWALSGLMRIDPARRAWAKAEALRRIEECRTDRTRRGILVECLETYTRLDEEQQEEFDRLFQSKPYEEARAMTKTIYDLAREEGRTEGIEKGIEKGRQELLARLLERKFGPLAPRTRSRIARLTSAEADRVVDDVFGARSLRELGL
jgi:hypothetical protein